MSKLEDNILQAIDIIVNKAVTDAGYDKTIQAVIVECIDKTIGKYRVKYQDSIFYAYSENTDVSYAAGASVYVLVPGNDMGNEKRIIGTTKKLGINYIPVVEDKDIYEVIGKNCISSNKTFGLHSYQLNGEVIVLYDKSDQSHAQITVNKTDLNEYIKQASNVKCGIQVKTALPLEQQYRGNFGIIFSLNFRDNATGSTVTRDYVLDVDKMTGNPYKQINKTPQYAIFDIDGQNFIEVNYIAIFCNNFLHSEMDPPVDIYISNLEFCAVSRLSDSEVNNCSLTIVTPQGTYFDSNSINSDIRRLEAQVRVKGSIVDYTSQKINFYWFVQDISIVPTSQAYNKYGGQGWKCLNNYNILKKTSENESDIVEWLPYGSVWQVRKSDVVAKEVRYKCVAIYDGNALSKEVVIKNFSSPYDITIVSDTGTKFYFDIGHPTLTTLINNKEQLGYTYAWAVTDNSGSFRTLPTTADSNNAYNALKKSYDDLKASMKNESVPVVTNQARLNDLANQLAGYDSIMRVEKNKLHKVQIKEITDFSIYQCAAYNNGVCLGTASITLVNSLQREGSYSLIINEGSYVYKYNNAGVAPTSELMEQPITIKALSFTVFDNLGNPIEDDIIGHSKISWKVPITNTLIVMDDDKEPPTSKTETDAFYENRLTLVYNIAKRYNIGCQRNTIELTVEYKDMILTAATNLIFSKEGEPGTNGTDYLCRIVPVKTLPTTGPWASIYPIAIENSSGTKYWNFDTSSATVQFQVQLWHNENNIFTGAAAGQSTEGKAVTNVKWEIPLNSYRERDYDNSPWRTTKTDVTRLQANANGQITFLGYSDSETNPPVNIIKCTLQYENGTYTATLPIISVKLRNNNYTIRLKDYTGFRFAIYANGGNKPTYDKTNPFTIVAMQNIGSNNWEDVSEKTSATYAITYTWSFRGKPDEDRRIDQNNVNTQVTRSQKSVRALDDYRGESRSNAVVCVLSHNGEVGRIHMPVHLYIDRYGNPNLNGWDGNSVVIDDKGGVILAPQIGAGHKETDNSFTGVVMGDVKEGYGQLETGFFGYLQGERTIFLDAKTGQSRFGKAGAGQIVIDPRNDKAQIYSGNFYRDGKETGEGMIIDLTTPEIRYGNGFFKVDKNGHLFSVRGYIGGWEISDTYLKSENNNLTLNCDGSMVGGNGNFRVDKNGYLYSIRGFIGGWEIAPTYLKSESNNLTLNSDGSMIGGHGNFSVSSQGVLYSTEGTIGGWTITEHSLRAGDMILWDTGAVEGDKWSISADGLAKFKRLQLENDSSEKDSHIDLGLLDSDEDRIILGDWVIRYASIGGSNEPRPAFFSLYPHLTDSEGNDGDFNTCYSGISAYIDESNPKENWIWLGWKDDNDNSVFSVTGESTYLQALKICGPGEITFKNAVSAGSLGSAATLTGLLALIAAKCDDLQLQINSIPTCECD